MTQSTSTPPFSQPKVRALVVYFLLFSFLVGLVLGGVQVAMGASLTDPLWVMVIYIALFIVLSLWLKHRLQQQGIQMQWLIGSTPERPRWFMWMGLVLAALVFSLSSFIVSASILSFWAPTFVETLLEQVAAEGNPQTANLLLYQIVTAIATVIVAPITEEFIFRGFILQRWAVKWNLPLSLIVTSLVFGLMHLNPVGLTVFGLLMGVLYIKTRSLLVPIVGHALNNLLATSTMFLPQDPNPTNLAALRSSLPIGIFLIVLSAPWLVWFIAKNFPRRDAEIPYVMNVQKHDSHA